MPYFLVEKTVKWKRLFCHIFLKVMKLKKKLDLLKKKKFKQIIKRI